MNSLQVADAAKDVDGMRRWLLQIRRPAAQAQAAHHFDER